MTSSTISAPRGNPASHGTLSGNQGTLHEHKTSSNDHWGTLNGNQGFLQGHQGTLHANQDTMHERQVTPATQATPNSHQGPPRTHRRTSEEADLYWSAYIIQEPVSHDMKALIRADLKKAWYFARIENFRKKLKIRWETTDYYRMVLDNALGEVEPRKLKYLCNKPTAFYWLQSAQGKSGYTGERMLMPKLTLAAIYEEWTRSHSIEPNIEYGHFFANPVRITATGPSTIQDVLEAHRSLCAQASCLIDQAGGRADNIIERKSSTSQNYALYPLYRALVVIIDHRIDITDHQIDPDGFISLRKVAQDQSVFIMRTGLEEGLSAPISFESLKSQSLPLNRPDATMQGLDVIRVSLASAVHFIVDLEIRENDADPKSKSKDEDTLDKSLDIYPPRGYEFQVSHSPETWVDAVMAAAEEHGYGEIIDASYSIRRIEASKIGEDFCPFEYVPFGREWRY